MIVRIWRTQLDNSRMNEFERFERERSLPMFRQQEGFLGVIFLRSQGECAALSLWEDLESVERLSKSKSYRETVQLLESTNLLQGSQSIEVFEERGGIVLVDAMRMAFGGELSPPS